jgi:hypothetical protein
MPNWCDNQVTITGPNSVIDKIEKIVKEESNNAENGLLQFFHPMPKALKDTVAGPEPKTKKEKLEKARLNVEYGASNWYDWRCTNWGTKWELCEFYGVDKQADALIGDSTISFAFSSAWSPPIGAYEQFLADNKDCSLKAYYYEGGCDFMGLWEDGVDDCYAPSDYKSTDDFWNDGVGSTLDDMFNITESMAEYEAELEQDRLNEDVYKYSKGEKINIGEDA